MENKIELRSLLCVFLGTMSFMTGIAGTIHQSVVHTFLFMLYLTSYPFKALGSSFENSHANELMKVS